MQPGSMMEQHLQSEACGLVSVSESQWVKRTAEGFG